jgi:hypothetical protein
MSTEKSDIGLEQKELVLVRFKTLNPDSKLSLGGDNEVTVRELIKHVEAGDDFGKKIVQVQINMIKILSGAV